MENLNRIYTFEDIAQKMGVHKDRFAYLRQVYENNRQHPTLMLQQLKALPKQEAITIMTYIGAVAAGQANDNQLYRSDMPG